MMRTRRANDSFRGRIWAGMIAVALSGFTSCAFADEPPRRGFLSNLFTRSAPEDMPAAVSSAPVAPGSCSVCNSHATHSTEPAKSPRWSVLSRLKAREPENAPVPVIVTVSPPSEPSGASPTRLVGAKVIPSSGSPSLVGTPVIPTALPDSIPSPVAPISAIPKPSVVQPASQSAAADSSTAPTLTVPPSTGPIPSLRARRSELRNDGLGNPTFRDFSREIGANPPPAQPATASESTGGPIRRWLSK